MPSVNISLGRRRYQNVLLDAIQRMGAIEQLVASVVV